MSNTNSLYSANSETTNCFSSSNLCKDSDTQMMNTITNNEFNTVKPIPQHYNQKRKKHHGQCGRQMTNLKKISVENGFKIALFNAHSIQAKDKRTAIVNFIEDENIDLMFITESWLKEKGDESKLKELTPKAYKIKSLPRGSRGGGILVIYRDHLSIIVNSIFSFSHKSFELLQLTLTSPIHLHFFCLYRIPPSKKNKLKTKDFINEFPELLDHVNMLRGKSILLGDFNVQFNNKRNFLTRKVFDMIDAYDLVQGVTEPTFYRSGNIVDWVLYRENDNLVSSCYISHLLSSDHAAVICHLNVPLPTREPIYKTIRDLKSIDMVQFKADVKSMVESHGESITAENLDDGLRTILDKHAPAVKKKVPIHKDPWLPEIAEKLREAKRLRRRAERRNKKSGLTVDYQILQARKAEVVDIIQTAREMYLCKKVEESKNSKSFYRTTNQILGKSNDPIFPSTIPEHELPEHFSSFFNDKIESIRKDLDTLNKNVDPLYADTAHTASSFTSFRTVTQDEVKTLIMQAHKKTCSLDAIPTSLLVECIEELLPAITYIINNSLTSGTFPDAYKHAMVTPLLKKQNLDNNVLKNYRPISNLSFLSKLLERIVLKQIIEYLNNFNLFPEYQSAYRTSHSTETTLLDISNHILQALDSGNLSLLALLDLSSAFDTIDHNILLKRLSHSYGINETILMWISSYLSNRSQIISTKQHISEPTSIK